MKCLNCDKRTKGFMRSNQLMPLCPDARACCLRVGWDSFKKREERK